MLCYAYVITNWFITRSELRVAPSPRRQKTSLRKLPYISNDSFIVLFADAFFYTTTLRGEIWKTNLPSLKSKMINIRGRPSEIASRDYNLIERSPFDKMSTRNKSLVMIK